MKLILKKLKGLLYLQLKIKSFLKWLVFSKEYTNFTYKLTQNNYIYLIHLCAQITKLSDEEVWAYFRELLRDSFQYNIDKLNIKYQDPVKLDRRVIWYILIRHFKPNVVVETGVDKGLGAAYICHALRRNKKGRYVGIDINPNAGEIVKALHKRDKETQIEIKISDSVTFLKEFYTEVDFLILDGNHKVGYEREEIRNTTLSENAIIISDTNNGDLLDYSIRTKRNYLTFQEHSKNHWFPGAEIGISFKP